MARNHGTPSPQGVNSRRFKSGSGQSGPVELQAGDAARMAVARTVMGSVVSNIPIFRDYDGPGFNPRTRESVWAGMLSAAVIEE